MKRTFEEFFGMPMPPDMAFDGDLTAVGHNLKPRLETDPDEALLLASEAALQKPLPVVTGLMSSFFSGHDGFYFIGFHEIGVNNCSFFYSRIDSWSRVYFRLEYGGIYTDTERRKDCIRRFLPRYFDFQRRLVGRVAFLLAVECAGQGSYTVILHFGYSYSVDESLECNPDFEGKFSELLRRL